MTEHNDNVELLFCEQIAVSFEVKLTARIAKNIQDNLGQVFDELDDLQLVLEHDFSFSESTTIDLTNLGADYEHCYWFEINHEDLIKQVEVLTVLQKYV